MSNVALPDIAKATAPPERDYYAGFIGWLRRMETDPGAMAWRSRSAISPSSDAITAMKRFSTESVSPASRYTLAIAWAKLRVEGFGLRAYRRATRYIGNH